MRFSGMRAFVVDDEPLIASTLAAILGIHGFSATPFTDPLKALASALIEPPKLLISDVAMPRLSGVDLAVQIKALSPECRVLLFSGHAANVDFRRDAQRIDANLHILPKPLDPFELLAMIQQQFEEN